jgi:NRPS condensation-like uncharacterized protein
MDYRPRIAVLETPGDKQDDPRDKILQFVSAPCDPEDQPPLKVQLIRTQAGDRLCFKIDHVLSDASGLKILLYLFAEVYCRGRISQPLNPDRGFGQIFKTFPLPALVNAARHAEVPRPEPALTTSRFDPEPVFIQHAGLDPAGLDAVRRAGKACGATINDMLLAATYRAAFERLPEDENLHYPVMVPVDMRRYLPEEKRWIIGNLSSAVYPGLSRRPAEDIRETLQRAKSAMDAFKQSAPGLGAAMLMTVGSLRGGRMLRDRYQAAAARGSRFINLTNFGIIEEARCRFGDLQPEQAYGVGPNQYAPGILIAVSTCCNWLHLVVQGNDTQIFQPFVREMLEAILNSLKAM